MPASSTTEGELKSAADFTRMYNKWFRELVSIEENLLMKAEQIQTFQNSLDSAADTLKRMNENLLKTEIEQNYVEDLLNVLSKEQEELQKELSKLEESIVQSSDANTSDYEECSALFESLNAQLTNVKQKVKTLVEKINSKDQNTGSENPFPVYRTILDHYADALQLLESNTVEIQERFDSLQEICLQRYIPSDVFTSPP